MFCICLTKTLQPFVFLFVEAQFKFLTAISFNSEDYLSDSHKKYGQKCLEYIAKISRKHLQLFVIYTIFVKNYFVFPRL